jgi:hypothetical protein
MRLIRDMTTACRQCPHEIQLMYFHVQTHRSSFSHDRIHSANAERERVDIQCEVVCIPCYLYNRDESRHPIPRPSLLVLVRYAELLTHLSSHHTFILLMVIPEHLTALSPPHQPNSTKDPCQLTSIFAPLSIFGSASMLSTLISTLRTPWTGDQRSEADSYCSGSSPGVWSMEIHTSPEG